MYKVEISRFVPPNWDQLIASVPEGTIYQTTVWAKFIKYCVKGDPIFLTVRNGNNIVGLLLLHKEGLYQQFLMLYFGAKLTVPVLKSLFSTLNWRYGPIILDKKNARKILNEILVAVDLLAKDEKICSINYASPPIHHFNNYEFEQIFERNQYIINKSGTFLVDLTQKEETIWGKIEKGARKNVRRSTNKGLEVEKISSKNKIKEYAKLLAQDKNIPFKECLRFSRLVYTFFCGKDYAWFFLAKDNKKYISGLLALLYNGKVFEVGVARSKYEKTNKLYAQDLIKWNLIKLALKKHQQIYDLTGINPEPKNQKEEGIFNYKKKWGGNIIKYNVYKKIYANRLKLLNRTKRLLRKK